MFSEKENIDNGLLTCYSEKIEVMSIIPKRGGKPVKVTLVFANNPKPQLRETIAEMLIESFMKRSKIE